MYMVNVIEICDIIVKVTNIEQKRTRTFLGIYHIINVKRE